MNSETVIPRLSDPIARQNNSAAIDRLIPTDDYRYIKAWGKFLGFTPETVQSYVNEARRVHAPPDVVQPISGGWLRLEDIQNETNRRQVEHLADGGT